MYIVLDVINYINCKDRVTLSLSGRKTHLDRYRYTRKEPLMSHLAEDNPAEKISNMVASLVSTSCAEMFLGKNDKYTDLPQNFSVAVVLLDAKVLGNIIFLSSISSTKFETDTDTARFQSHLNGIC